MSNDECNSAGGHTRSGIPVAPSGVQTLRIDENPAPENQRVIHPRRPLPLTPDTEDRDDDSASDSNSSQR